MAKLLLILMICSLIIVFVYSRGEELFPILDKYCKKNLSTKSKEAIMKCENDFDPKLFDPVRNCVRLIHKFDSEQIPKPTICYLSHYKNPKSYKKIEMCINDYFKQNPFNLTQSNEQMENFVDCLKKLPLKKKKSEKKTEMS